MKKLPLVAAVVACLTLAFALVGCGSSEPENAELTVAGATITYPSDWVVIDAQDNGLLGDSVTEAKGVSPAADSQTAVALADMTAAQVDLATMETGLDTLGYEVTSTTLSGCEAIAFTMPVGDITAQAYVIQAGDRMLMLIGAIDPEEDEAVREQFNSIMASFTYTGASSTDTSADGEGSSDGEQAADAGDAVTDDVQAGEDAAADAADVAQDEADSGE